jgi:hypothetical protein
MPFTWEEGVIIDNAISTPTNQSNTHQRTGSVRSGADQNTATNNAASGEGSSKNSFGAGPILNVSSEHPHSSPTPPLQRRLAKSFSVAPSHSQSKGSYANTIIKSLTITFFLCCTLFSFATAKYSDESALKISNTANAINISFKFPLILVIFCADLRLKMSANVNNLFISVTRIWRVQGCQRVPSSA